VEYLVKPGVPPGRESQRDRHCLLRWQRRTIYGANWEWVGALCLCASKYWRTICISC